MKFNNRPPRAIGPDGALTLTFRHMISATNLEIAEMKDVAGTIAGAAVFQITRRIAAQHLESFEYKRPASPWQHFKQRYFPAFLQRRFPVLEEVTLIDAQALYPNVSLWKKEPFVLIANPRQPIVRSPKIPS